MRTVCKLCLGTVRKGLHAVSHERCETGLLKLMVEGQGFLDFASLHDNEACVIDQAPTLVQSRLGKIKRSTELLTVLPYLSTWGMASAVRRRLSLPLLLALFGSSVSTIPVVTILCPAA